MNSNPVILFDGVCNLCNGAVNFIISRNKKQALKFAALQSEAGQRLLKEHRLPDLHFDTIVLIENGKVYTRSTAALKVCKYLDTPWPLLAGLIIVPEFIRDGVYAWIARNRYRWFGKQDQCRIPTPELRNRFLP